jgi:hypothetical protein
MQHAIHFGRLCTKLLFNFFRMDKINVRRTAKLKFIDHGPLLALNYDFIFIMNYDVFRVNRSNELLLY